MTQLRAAVLDMKLFLGVFHAAFCSDFGFLSLQLPALKLALIL